MPESSYEAFVQRIESQYQSDPEKLNQFRRCMGYLLANSVGRSETNITAQDALFTYQVVYSDPKSLKVTSRSSGDSAAGYIRDLFDLKDSLSGAPDSLYCSGCQRSHMKYGVELEINLFGDDPTYKTLLLRKVMNKRGLQTSLDRVGLDGSGGPVEIRAINSNDPEEMERLLMDVLSKVKESFKFIKDNFPETTERVDINNCGTHIHTYHKNIPRDKVVTAHTATAMLINSFNESVWRGRYEGSYGKPFAFRNQTPWCREGQYATELRVLNSLNPKVIRFAIESMEQVLKNNFNVTQQEFVNFERRERAQQYSTHINKYMAFFVDNGVFTFGQLKVMKRWLDKNYRNLPEDFLCAR